jgi:hypothetical protein
MQCSCWEIWGLKILSSARTSSTSNSDFGLSLCQPVSHEYLWNCFMCLSYVSLTITTTGVYKPLYDVPYTCATTQMGRNSGSCSISTSASPDLLDSVNLHIFGKHSATALWWYQSFFHIFWLSSSFGGPERELLGRRHPSPNYFLVRA